MIEETSKIFREKIKSKSNLGIKYMKNLLSEYLQSLNNDNLILISNKIMSNFISYKEKIISKKLHNLTNICKKIELFSLQEKFEKWRQQSIKENMSKIEYANSSRENYFHLNLNVGPIMNNSSGVPIIINNNSNNNDIKNRNINKFNGRNNLTKNKNLKNNKKNDLKNNYNTINNSSSNYNTSRIGQYSKHLPNSSEGPKRTKDYMILTKNSESSLFKGRLIKGKNESESIMNKFIKRQDKYSKNNLYKKEKLKKENEEEYKLIYTFEPKVNSSLRKLYKKNSIPASKRLYNDSIIRKNRRLEKELYLNNSTKNINKSINQNKYQELYEESKIRKTKNKELIKKIEKECGYTYAPNVFSKNNNMKNNKNSHKKSSSQNSIIDINLASKKNNAYDNNEKKKNKIWCLK